MHVNRDRVFFKVGDGEFSDAKEALVLASIGWLSGPDQSFLFFAAARTRSGSEHLEKICIKMGADLSEVHKKTQQTPLFNAASRGTLQIFVKHGVRGEFSR